MTVTARRFTGRPGARLAADGAVAAALLAGAEIADGSSLARALLAVLIVAPLAARRVVPVAAWAVPAAATAVALASGESAGFAVLAPLAGLYTVASRSGRRASLTAGAVTLAGCALLGVSGSPSSVVLAGSRIRGNGAIVLAVLAGVCWLIGDNVRMRRAHLAELQAKARCAVAEREQGLARAAALERARIARELHDVVVHHVSGIAVQAGAGRLMAERAPGRPPPADAPTWAGIEASARQALTELRQLLGVLRSDHEPPSRAPQPGLHDLKRLLDESGLPVRARVDDDLAGLPAAASLAGFRIVQEALTNVRKHQDGGSASVVVRRLDGELRIEVTSQPGPSGVSGVPCVSGMAGVAGHGLAGMRERVALLGGSLDARPRPGGGFLVEARIPLG